LLLACLTLSAALAHEPGLSYAQVSRDSLVQTFSTLEMQALGEREALGEVLEGLTFSRTTVLVDGQACAVGASSIQQVEGDGIQIQAELDCPSGTSWTYETAFLADLSPGHRHYVEAFGQPIAILDLSTPSANFEAETTNGQVALAFVKLGVEHIWTGFDHLAFLLALLLIAGSLRQMLAIVTGFTLAHSITLSLAALGAVVPPAAIVEPAIALTIAYTGIENLWRPGPRRRFFVTFGLGLIHGFGFAGLLIELGLPKDHLLTALLCFNGGVEIGQACVVLVALPVLLLLGRYPFWRRRAVPAASLAIAAAGILWFLERVL
jgi:hydrogenase/urease accessory protein HupE